MKHRPKLSNTDRLADWSNYQTWLVACDVFRAEHKCVRWQVLTWYESQSAAASLCNSVEDCRVAQMQAIETIAAQLKSNYQEMARKSPQPLLGDLLRDCLNHVVWTEIANGLILSLILDMTPKVPRWQICFNMLFGPRKKNLTSHTRFTGNRSGGRTRFADWLPAVDQGPGQTRLAATTGRTRHRILCSAGAPRRNFLDRGYFRAVGGSGPIGKSRFSPQRSGVGVFPAAGALAATPQQRFPVLAIRILLDPGVDRLRRNAPLGVLLLHPARDLFRRPLLRQGSTDGVVDFRIVHLADQGTFLSPLLRLAMSLRGVVFLARAVALQLAADGGWRAAQGLCDFRLTRLPRLPRRYAITFFHRKMTGHRWDSIPKGKVCKTSPLGTSQRCFYLDRLAPSCRGGKLRFRFETAIMGVQQISAGVAGIDSQDRSPEHMDGNATSCATYSLQLNWRMMPCSR